MPARSRRARPPPQLTGLAAGLHTISVRAVDNATNTGDADTEPSPSTALPAGGGGGSTPQQRRQQPLATADKTAPKVSVVAKSSRASKKGTVSFRVGCPTTETSCKVTLQLKNGANTVARKTVTVKGGKTMTVTLQLTKATRQQLKHSTLKISTVVTANDAAGNQRTTTQDGHAARPA